MYSFNPLPIIDTVNSHGGFWLVFCILGIITAFAFIIALDYDDKQNWKSFLFVFVFCGTIIAFTGYNSWTTGTITVPKNEKVIGTFKGFNAEGEAYTERSGKQTVRRENHYLYVVYSIEGQGVITFKALSGITYPEKAILYKN
jgi:hypothetical protein